MDSSPHNAVAAAFSDREMAHACYEALDREGFPHRWMAVTKPADNEAWGDGSAETTSENDIVESSDGALGAIGRFFSGEGNSLRRSLEDHGIDTDEAIEIDEALHLGGAVVVVAGHDRSDIAASILRAGGGRFYGKGAQPSAAYDVATDTLVTSAAAPLPATREAATSAAAVSERVASDPMAPVAAPDATSNEAPAQTLQLREERLEISKQRVSAGEATVGARVVSEPVSVDVPVAHEELFIERHSVDGSRAASGAIGADETIVVPLQREEVVVEKVPFVREEVVVGQRRVEETERVRETLLREELEINEPARRPAP